MVKKRKKSPTGKKKANKKRAARSSTTPKRDKRKKATKKKSPKKKPANKRASKKNAANKTASEASPEPRRFEFEDSKSAKFWSITLDGSSHTVEYGRIGTRGQSTMKEFESEAKALASYEKLIAQKTKKGYSEIISPAPKTAAELRREQKLHEPFLQQIIDAPDDIGAYGVYADWLQEQGDPRGEFIQVQIMLEDESLDRSQRNRLKRREKLLLAKHEIDWLGPYAEFLTSNQQTRDPRTFQTRSNYSYSFERGFLASLHVNLLVVPFARMMRDADQTRMLRRLSINEIATKNDDENQYEPGPDVPTWSRDRIAYGAIYPLLGTKQFSCLKNLTIGDPSGVDDISPKNMQHGQFYHSAYCICNPVLDLIARMPRLQELHLYCKDYDIDGLFATKKLKELEVLRIYHQGLYGAKNRHRKETAFPLSVLAKNAAFANLRHLAFHPHHEENDAGSFLPRSEVVALLNSKKLKNLQDLQIRLSDFGDEGCLELVKSGILNQLKRLDLRHGIISDIGVETLLNCADIHNLDHLDLSRNALTRRGVSALKKSGLNFRADVQYTPRQVERHVYLYEGDFE